MTTIIPLTTQTKTLRFPQIKPKAEMKRKKRLIYDKLLLY
jgi:hypothetical protein